MRSCKPAPDSFLCPVSCGRQYPSLSPVRLAARAPAGPISPAEPPLSRRCARSPARPPASRRWTRRRRRRGAAGTRRGGAACVRAYHRDWQRPRRARTARDRSAQRTIRETAAFTAESDPQRVAAGSTLARAARASRPLGTGLSSESGLPGRPERRRWGGLPAFAAVPARYGTEGGVWGGAGQGGSPP